MFNQNHIAVFDLVQSAAPALPISQRIKVYRGLADMVGNEPQAKQLLASAKVLEDAEKKCAELKLVFVAGGKQ